METIPNDRRAVGPRRTHQAHDVSDEVLVAGMAAGDDAAAAAFVRRHQGRVFGIALAITSDRAAAEDVAQETFLRAWRHAAVFDPRRAPATAWLSTITRNLSIDAVRLLRSVPVDRDDAVWRDAEAGGPSPESSAEHRVAVDRVSAALREVPVEQRRALLRSTLYGQSASEIADAEAIPLGTAKSRIRLGLSRVRDLLAGEEG